MKVGPGGGFSALLKHYARNVGFNVSKYDGIQGNDLQKCTFNL